MKSIFTILLCLYGLYSFAQTGNIRGRITDNASETPIEGATISIVGDSIYSTLTDADGNYRLLEVPVGRKTLEITFMGYESVTIPNIAVITGKDVLADAKLNESFNNLDEIVITSGTNKDKPLNKMAAVSARQIGVEEISRYAGGRSDVARLATNFAGVSAPDDSRNDIVVRGNSPTGVLWRIEGVPVPSPNHFSTLGTTGSPVSALNANVLANFDFFTSAFPAEYGNALGGVFDISFRKGNSDHYEYMLSAGAFSGGEAMAEGPLGKKGSFLASGRYGLASAVGAGGTSASPNYRDIAFNFDLGETSWGRFSIFGIAASSDIDFLGKDIDEDDLFAAPDENMYVTSNFFVAGLKHTIKINDYSSIKTSIGGTFSGSGVDVDRKFNYETPQETTLKFTHIDNSETRFTVSSTYNSKISNRFTLKAGILFELYEVDAMQTTRERQTDNDGDGYPDYINLLNTNDGYSIAQPFAQGQYRLMEKLTLNAGIHTQSFSLNNEFVIEPRASLLWNFTEKQSLSIGYGIHHQNVPAPILFLNENINGTMVQTNPNLDLVKSSHYVLGYDVRLGNEWRTKLEIYYQDIDNAAVESFPSSYSSLTEGADFGFSIDKHSLVSKGTGHNAGIELTLEKFFSRGFYGLFTTSLFEAKYKGSDGIERNSPFNNGYVVNLLGGKEFKVGKQGKNALFFDTKLSTAGGKYYTPVDLAASNAAGFEILQNDKAYSEQYNPYFRVDVKFGMKLNSSKKKVSHQFYIDLQNVTNNDNVFARRYNRLTNSVEQIDQIGFFPDFGYKFQF